MPKMNEFTDEPNPRLKGTAVTVIDVYHSYAREGYQPAEIANIYDIGLDDVHSAIAYYYSNAPDLMELGYDSHTVSDVKEHQERLERIENCDGEKVCDKKPTH